MQNEFEKQVQLKMEELRLTPSAPVWEKVEQQIRQKKERRRLLFWIPLIILFLGGGLWFVLTNKNERSSYANEMKKQNSSLPSNNDNRTVNKTDNSNTENKIQTEKLSDKNDSKSNSSNSIKEQASSKPANTITSPNKTQNSIVNTQRISGKKNSETRISIQKPNATSEKSSEEKPIQKSEDIIKKQPSEQTSEAPTNNSTKKEEIKETVNDLPKKEEIKQDTAATKKLPPKKAAESKWKYAVALQTGLSGFGEGFSFGGQKSMDAIPITSPSQTPFYNYATKVNDVKKGFSFGVGIAAIKNLGKRFSFLTGLNYKYYSNSLAVGERIDSSSSLGVTSSFNFAARTDSIQNSYRNKYHFISLPLVFNWQIAKKLPLKLEAGFALQQLLHTNGLVFNSNSQRYSRDKDQFHKTQLFYEMGLNYTIPLKNNDLTLGPQLEYGLTKMDKTNWSKHLVSFGLKAQLSLKKN